MTQSSFDRSVSLPARVVVSLRAGAVLALANIVCVLIFSWAWVHVKAEPKTIAVTGSARKPIESDLIVWSGRVSASDSRLDSAYNTLRSSTNKVLEYLKAAGVPGKEITVGSIETLKHFERDAKGNNTDKITSYELAQTVEVSSNDVGKVENVARTVTDLIKEDVLLDSQPPKYLYTKLADLKIAMLAEATADATTRAQQIAGNSGSKLGKIIEARMGVMQINAIHSNDASGSGVNDTSSREKEITAVVSARFSLQ